MKVGIIGFARSGKTTIFNSLTGAQAEVGAFGSRDANVAVLKVPDERVDKLAEIFKPKKVTYAEFQFVDVAPAESVSDDKALNQAALTALKQTDTLVHVVRAFENESVVHPLESVDPVRDCKAMEEELQLDDFIIIERRLERLAKENKKGLEFDLLTRCKEHIEQGKPLRTLELDANQTKELCGYCFLSQKPVLLLGNYGEENIGNDNPSGLSGYAQETGQILIELCGAMEMEVSQLPQEDRGLFREELGLGEESKVAFIKTAYDMLGLMSFLTAGEPEVRAWTINKGTGKFEKFTVTEKNLARGFIRAEVVNYDNFIAAGSMAKIKEAGQLHLEGKDYIVQDGDMLLIRFNV